MTKWLLRGGVAAAALLGATAAQAQAIPGGATAATAPVSASDIIVTADIAFRNRTEDANPVVSYDLDYFQRFEPVSVGEMLKRVPGVTFTSDVLEYDGVQMRGLPAGFTQVLINGRRAPGSGADRSFFVDRLPAELVERIEIVRAPRADQPSDGVAGTLNVITKESAAFEGGFAKTGALINEDGKVRPSGAIAYAGELGEATSFWAALNYQERRNPKKKVSLRFDDETSGPFDETNAAFSDTELQADTRDGRDISGNAELTTALGEGKLRISGLFVDTDRDEDETSLTYAGADLDFDGVEIQQERIKQKTYAITADGSVPLGGVELGFAAGWSGFRDHTTATTFEGDNEDDLTDVDVDEVETTRIKDDEYSGTLSLGFGPEMLRFKLGVDLFHKTRDGTNAVDDDAVPSTTFRIKEDRYDPYARLTFELSPEIAIDAGLRYEITRRDTTGNLGSASYDAESLNPSLHFRYAPTSADQFRASIARTVRRPNYDLISPYEQEETPGDEDITAGNPALKNERAWGVDIGYERRLGQNGILGVNFFYRDISDLTELVAIGDVLSDDDEDENGLLDDVIGNRFTPQNVGDGETWGVELDFSAPLDVIGLPDTGLFANYTYLDSSTRDPFTGEKRRFNHQPHHVYNVGFIQTVRSVDASFGASLSGRSKSLESNFDETVTLTYQPDLEAFIEKRFGKNFVLRATASNLLNRAKRETFRKYDGDSRAEILANRANGDLDEFEIERERAGRLFQVTLRAAF